MRLLQWNLQWCRGIDGVVDPARIARVARELGDPDICCFQEVAVNFPALAGSSGEDQAMQLALLDGWLGAALEIAPESRAALTSWHQRRRSHVLGGRSELRVGHVDLIGWL